MLTALRAASLSKGGSSVAGARSNLIAGIVVVLVAAAGCGSGQTTAPATDLPAASPPERTEAPLATPPKVQPPIGSSAVANSVLPAGPVVIATFGDSLTQGDCDNSGRGYPARLLELVNRLRPGSSVVNVGHSGWTSGDLANTANDPPTEIARAIDANPDIALVWIGSNDLWALYDFGPAPMTSQAEQEDLVAYETNLDTILFEIEGQGRGHLHSPA